MPDEFLLHSSAADLPACLQLTHYMVIHTISIALSEQNTCAQHSCCPAEKNNPGSRAAEKLVSLSKGESCLRTEAS